VQAQTGSIKQMMDKNTPDPTNEKGHVTDSHNQVQREKQEDNRVKTHR